MSKILLLMGGSSSEREISLRSGTAVRKALEQVGHEVTTLDTAEPIEDAAFDDYDAIFPVLHGSGGEDGVLQARLEARGHHNFVGSDAVSSALCFDKWEYKQLLDQHGILNATGAMVSADEIQAHPLTQAPFVLKPSNGGSSVDTFIVRDIATVDFSAMEAACARHKTMLLEALIEGVEITIGVLDDTALPVIEIIPPVDGEFDYENKYNGTTQELCPPVNVAADGQAEAQALALQIHKLCGCRDFSRTDIMVAPDNKLYVIETNTIPGMTDESLFPKAAATAGVPMVDLCDQLVSLAAARA
ncbi:MAG: D-alanine--D-alanine ligase [Candidatus Saccharibacteria bacterium]|nr:D-alanine--D-alanine ligase [Candidatus Saccharibacteria bacterium]